MSARSIFYWGCCKGKGVLRAQSWRTSVCAWRMPDEKSRMCFSSPMIGGECHPCPKVPAQAGKGVVELPKACPKCSQPVVRVIWRWVHLFGRNLEDLTTGQAILGSPVDAGGPPWVCLQCEPKWSEVHHLALQELELQIEKENAIVAADFEKAAQCRDRQTAVRRQTVILLDELLRKR